jgi:hypothetical protein
VLYDLYQQLEQTALYDTETAFGVFAVMLNYNNKFSSAFPRGIDFTRANKDSSLPDRFR